MKKNSVVFVSGNFNILHPGHLRLLRFAKECGERLVVAVLSDRISGLASHVPENLRLECIQSNQWVDEAFIADEPIVTVIERLKPDVVVKGKEHEQRLNPELAVLESYGGQLLFSSGETAFSSLDLIRKEYFDYESLTIKLPSEFMLRHGITNDRILKIIDNFSRLKVCVVGDLIVDEYITCESLGMSQEEPTIVVTPIDSTCFIGGAGIVAAHASGLGANVCFLSVAGPDTTRDFAAQRLHNYGVTATLLIDESRPTTLKQRYRSKGKSLLRVSHLHQSAISSQLQKKFLKALDEEVNNTDVLVFSDFNYGCLPQPMVDQIIQKARGKKIIFAADSQSSSQVGDISRFKGMDLITPTEREARIALRNHEDGLVVIAEKLRQQSGARNILLKLGEEGVLVHAGGLLGGSWHTDRVDALNSAPKDVAGAGDSLLVTSAMTLACGGSIWEAACIGSLTAAVQVSRVGNTPIRSHELMQELK